MPPTPVVVAGLVLKLQSKDHQEIATATVVWEELWGRVELRDLEDQFDFGS